MSATPVGSSWSERFAAVADVLARATRDGEVLAADVLRILRHELRRRNTNRTDRIPVHSREVERVRAVYAALGQPIPKNSSPDALHADHLNRLEAHHLERLTTRDAWLAELSQLTEVVCVTARENYNLEAVERKGIRGVAKYEEAGVELIGLPETRPAADR